VVISSAPITEIDLGTIGEFWQDTVVFSGIRLQSGRMLISTPKPAMALPVSPPKKEVRSRRQRGRRIIIALLVGIGLALGAEVARVLFMGNVHEVVPGRVYRSAQLSPEKLRNVIARRGIRTVINLRGCCNPFDWYLDECRVTHDLNVSQEDITLSAIRLPPPSEIKRLIEVLDRSEYPIIMHCRQGADRTGLASAVSMLLHSDADLATARRQCSPRYAHFAVLETANMDKFFDMYESWLNENGLTHSPELFRSWAINDYRPDPAPARIELVGKVPTVPVDTSESFKIRATNISPTTWEFKTGTYTAIHVRAVVENHQGKVIHICRAGLFEARVAPGESIDIPITLPPLHQVGRHRVIVDLVDRNVNFCQLGSDWLELEVPVVARSPKN
jgi:protein tyrosine phosphatase (PTP) superfamily phosphohydrolase (DUF442 family)